MLQSLVASGPLGVVLALVLFLWRREARAAQAREDKLTARVLELSSALSACQEARIARAEKLADRRERATP